MSSRPESMGIYKDLAKKRESAYDTGLEQRVKAWIEALIKRPLNGPNFRESLLDMVAVCDLINAIQPGKIKRIRNSPVMLFRRENFVSFCNAAQEMGVPQNDLCQFEDIYDDKNMGQFLILIISLARQVQYKTGYKGPILQDAVKQGTKIQREMTEEQRLAAASTIPLGMKGMADTYNKAKEESRYTEHGIIMNPHENPENKLKKK